MIKRIIFSIMIIIFLFANGSAFLVNQGELDSIDAQTYNLQCQRETIGNPNYQIINNRFVIGFSCLDIRRISPGSYEVERKIFYPRFFLSDYNRCLTQFSESECVAKYTAELQSQINLRKSYIRYRIERLQTPTANAPTQFRNISLT